MSDRPMPPRVTSGHARELPAASGADNAPYTPRDTKMRVKDWLAIVVMPAAIALGAAVLAFVLQDRSFRANQLFSLKLTQINSGQQAAIDILRDVDRTFRQIRSDEAWIRTQSERPTPGLQHDFDSYRNGDYFAASIDTMKDSKVRVDALVASSEATGAGKAVSAAAGKYTNELATLVQCLQRNNEFRCTESSAALLPALRDIVNAHTMAANELIRQSR